MTKTPIAVLGIDLGKNSCSLAGMDAAGSVVMLKRMTRDAIVTFAANLPTCFIAMEACCGAHVSRNRGVKTEGCKSDNGLKLEQESCSEIACHNFSNRARHGTILDRRWDLVVFSVDDLAKQVAKDFPGSRLG